MLVQTVQPASKWGEAGWVGVGVGVGDMGLYTVLYCYYKPAEVVSWFYHVDIVLYCHYKPAEVVSWIYYMCMFLYCHY